MWRPLLLLAVLLSSSAALAEEAKIGIAVLNPTTSGGIAEDLPPVLAGVMSTKLDQSGVFKVVSEDDVKRIVSFDQMKTALSCDDQASCLAEVGQALGVPWLLTSSVAQVGSTFIVNLALIDIEQAKSVKRESSTYTSLDDVVKGLPAQVERTAASLLFRERGKLLVLASEEGSTISVDGTAIGTSPLKEQEVSSGPHRVAVAKEGFIQHTVDVTVRPREQTLVDARLRPSPEYLAAYQARTGGQRAAAWGTVVGGVASVAVGGGGVGWFFFRREGIRSATGLSAAADVGVNGAEYAELAAAFWGGISAAVVGVGLLGTGVVLFGGDDPARYDGVQ